MKGEAGLPLPGTLPDDDDDTQDDIASSRYQEAELVTGKAMLLMQPAQVVHASWLSDAV